MSTSRLASLHYLEGRRVCLALAGGDRIDDCQLISLGRGRYRSIWVFSNGCDCFVARGDVIDCWEAPV